MSKRKRLMKLPEEPYMGISIKKPLGQHIQEFIDEHPELGYKGVADFAAEAIRLRLEQIKGGSVKPSKSR